MDGRPASPPQQVWAARITPAARHVGGEPHGPRRDTLGPPGTPAPHRAPTPQGATCVFRAAGRPGPAHSGGSVELWCGNGRVCDCDGNGAGDEKPGAPESETDRRGLRARPLLAQLGSPSEVPLSAPSVDALAGLGAPGDGDAGGLLSCEGLESRCGRNSVNCRLSRFMRCFSKCLRMTLRRDGGRKIAIKVLSSDLFGPSSCPTWQKGLAGVRHVETAPGRAAVNMNQDLMTRSRPRARGSQGCWRLGQARAQYGPGRRDRE